MLGNESDLELYNLAKDRTEVNSLADTFPEKVGELSGLWEEIAYKYQVCPAL